MVLKPNRLYLLSQKKRERTDPICVCSRGRVKPRLRRLINETAWYFDSNGSHQEIEGITPLQKALLSGALEEVETILKEQLHQNIEVEEDDVLPEVIQVKKCSRIIHFLLDQKFDLNISTEIDGIKYQTLLHFAILNRDNQSFHFILKEDRFIHVRAALPISNSTLLHAAVIHGTTEMTKALLERGANPNATTIHGSIPMEFACGDLELNFLNGTFNFTSLKSPIKKESKVVEYLLNYGSDLFLEFIIGNENATPLLSACGAIVEYPEIVNFLLQYSANFSWFPCIHTTENKLHVSVICGHRDIVQLLVEKGLMDPNVRSRLSQMPLFKFLYFDHLSHQSTIEHLIEHGVEVGAIRSFGKSPPLHWLACVLDFRDLSYNSLECFLIYEPKINASLDPSGMTALEFTLRFYSYFKRYPLETKSRFWVAFNTFCAHVAKLKASNEYISEQNLNVIKNHPMLNDMFEACNSEIDRMKMEKISNLYTVSYFDILSANNLKLAAFARNEDLMKVLVSRESSVMFPTYAGYLTNSIDEAKVYKSLYEVCTPFLEEFAKRFKLKLPHFILLNILGNLRRIDLINYQKAYATVSN